MDELRPPGLTDAAWTLIKEARMKYDKAYDQVAHPSAGGSVPASKGGEVTTPCEALGNPGRFTRNGVMTATPRSDNKLNETRDEQLGTNIELTWTRYGKDKTESKTDQQFKKNFDNPTD